ncbi:MAG TPA: 50S ribosomal protein L3 [Acidobacteriota bacterium]|nr:50S ribosomal protein L3 [Acidobacteriota bacterium]HMZ80723.1 50S ribosomal protein L3 [Acidobacteriota bacterium]HNB69851.1 50S ribosomal protein L3 [Acidobacteriota bacterium]HND19463.1 50S ribosomal protein L3 [Acidobacteriota bacterium]
MVNGIIGKKVGMTQLFAPDGTVTPVTVLQAGPCVVVQRKTVAKDGYSAVQLGLVENRPPKKVSKPIRGHFEKTGKGTPPTRILREFRVSAEEQIEVGAPVLVDLFSENEKIQVVGTSKGRGFAGFIKRHGFGGGRSTHGSMFHRAPGSIGSSAFPSRVFPGTRMAGHMGVERKTIKNLKIVRVDSEKNLLIVKGSIPGPNGGYVLIQKAGA